MVLSYWNQDKSKLWIKCPKLPANSYSEYIIEKGDVSVSKGDGDNTFEFFDDFEGSTLDATKWSAQSGGDGSSISSSINTITGSGTTTTKGIKTISYWGSGYATTSRHKPSTNTGVLWAGLMNSAQSKYAGFNSNLNPDGTQTRNTGDQNITLSNFSTSNYANYEIINNSATNYIFKIDGTTVSTHASQVPTDNMYENIYVYNSSDTYMVDYVFVRKYNSSEPIYYITSLGSDKYKVKVFNNSSTILTDYQVPINLSDMSATSDYLDFTITEIPYWNQDKSKLWIKCPTLPAGESRQYTITKSTIVDDEITSISNLVSWYKFAGNANDSKGTNNGTVSGATYTTDQYGRSTNCLSVATAASDYCEIPDSATIDNNQNLSLMFWYKGTDTTTTTSFVMKGNSGDYQFGIVGNTTGQYDAVVWTTTGSAVAYVRTTATKVFDGYWHRICITIANASDLILYEDGAFVGNDNTWSGTWNYEGARPIRIGKSEDRNGKVGLYDSVRFYNKTISATEESLIYNSEKIQKGNGDSTFELFDDFDRSSLDTTKWIERKTATGFTSTITVSGGEFNYTSVKAAGAAAGYSFIESYITFGNGYEINTRNKFGTTASNKYPAGYGFGYTYNSTYSTAGIVRNIWTSSQYYYITNTDALNETDGGAGISYTADTYYIFKNQRQETNVDLYRDATLEQNFTTDIPTTSVPVTLGSTYHGGGASSTTQEATFDWVFVKKLNSTEPTVSVSGNNPYIVTVTNSSGTALTDYQVPIELSDLGTATDYYVYYFDIRVLPTDPTGLTVTPTVAYTNSTLTATGSGSDSNYRYQFYNYTNSSVLQDYSDTNTYSLTTSLSGKTVRIYVKGWNGIDYSTNSYYVDRIIRQYYQKIVYH